jgi:hypothetical protein
MEILKAPLFFMNNIKIENQKSGETHARISQKNFTATDGRTDGRRTHKKSHFFKFF